MSNLPPPSAQPSQPPSGPSGGDGGGPGAATGSAGKGRKPLWKRWWVITLAVLFVIVVIGAIAGGGKKDDEDGAAGTTSAKTTVAAVAGATTVATTTADSTAAATDQATTEAAAAPTAAPTTFSSTTAAPTTAAPTTAAPPAKPVIGDTLNVGDGAIARVNSVAANAEPLNDFIKPDPGTTFTRVAVELCAGSKPLSVNPLYFSAALDDNTTADVALGGQALETFTVAPGGCTGGTVDVTVPDGRTVGSVVLTGGLLSEVGRWSTASANPVVAPLAPTSPPASAALGELATLDDGATAVIRSFTPNAPPRNQFSTPDPGNQLVEIDVELCAGSAPLSVNPLYWLVTDTGNVTYSAELGGQTLTTIELAAGNCTAGVVAFEMPDASTPAYGIVTAALLEEVGRWRTA